MISVYGVFSDRRYVLSSAALQSLREQTVQPRQIVLADITPGDKPGEGVSELARKCREWCPSVVHAHLPDCGRVDVGLWLNQARGYALRPVSVVMQAESLFAPKAFENALTMLLDFGRGHYVQALPVDKIQPGDNAEYISPARQMELVAPFAKSGTATSEIAGQAGFGRKAISLSGGELMRPWCIGAMYYTADFRGWESEPADNSFHEHPIGWRRHEDDPRPEDATCLMWPNPVVHPQHFSEFQWVSQGRRLEDINDLDIWHSWARWKQHQGENSNE